MKLETENLIREIDNLIANVEVKERHKSALQRTLLHSSIALSISYVSTMTVVHGLIAAMGSDLVTKASAVVIAASTSMSWSQSYSTWAEQLTNKVFPLEKDIQILKMQVEAIKSRFSYVNSEITNDEIMELIKSIKNFQVLPYTLSSRANQEIFLNSLKAKESVRNLMTLVKLGANRQDCHIDFFKEKELKQIVTEKVPSLVTLAVLKMAENNIKLPEVLAHLSAPYEILEAYKLETPQSRLGKRKSNEAADENTSFIRQPFKRVKRMLFN